jgi:hypothetical protein
MRDFYLIKETYQRNEECDKIGFLIYIQDKQLREFYKISAFDEAPRYMLQFYHVQSKYKITKIFQQPLMNDEKINNCSVSKDFAVFEIVNKEEKNKTFKQKITVVNFKEKEQKEVFNPFKVEKRLSAVYIDEKILIFASKTKIIEVKLTLLSNLNQAYIEKNMRRYEISKS